MASQKRLNAISTINVHEPGNNDLFFTMINVVTLKTKLYFYFLSLNKYLRMNDLLSEALISDKIKQNSPLDLIIILMINKNTINTE